MQRIGEKSNQWLSPFFLVLLQVEAVEVHDLGPGGDEVADELFVGVGAGVDLGDGAQLRVGAEDEVGAGGGPLLGLGLAVEALPELAVVRGLGPGGGDVEQVLEVVGRQLALVGGEDARVGAVEDGAEGAHAADEHRHLGGRERQLRGLVDEELLGAGAGGAAAAVAEAVGLGLEEAEGADVGLFLGGVDAAGGEGDGGGGEAGVLGGLLDGGGASEDDEVGEGDLLGPGVEGGLDLLEGGEDLGQLLGVVGGPVDLGLEGDAGAVGTAALVRGAEGGGRGPGDGGELGDVEARGGEDVGLELGDVAVVDQLARPRGQGVLPDVGLLGDVGAEVAGDGAEVAVEELEPGLGEGVGELLRVAEPAGGDLEVGRVVDQGQVAREHGGLVELGLVKGVREVGGGVDGLPLASARGAGDKGPLVAQERLQETVAPSARQVTRSDNLESAGHRVDAVAVANAVVPSEAHLANVGTLRLGADVVCDEKSMDMIYALTTSHFSVRLAKGVAAANEGSGLLVVHAHAVKGDADVPGRVGRVGVAVGALGVDVDEAHVGGGQRLLELVGALLDVDAAVVAHVVAVGHEGRLAAPVDGLVGLPGVRAAGREAGRLEAHGLEGDVARQEHQVRPRDLVAILCLDRPCTVGGEKIVSNQCPNA
ncbi:hypothetical protein CTA2_8973 [Colletotrichum tanaceti]|nr:hypothetical protein CTA2_8973 [Colletotrichum tanaceti]